MKHWVLISIIVIGVISAATLVSIAVAGRSDDIPSWVTLLCALVDAGFTGLFAILWYRSKKLGDSD